MDNALGIRVILEHVVDVGAATFTFVSDTALSSTGQRRLDAFELEVRRVKQLVAGPPLLGSFSVEFRARGRASALAPTASSRRE